MAELLGGRMGALLFQPFKVMAQIFVSVASRRNWPTVKSNKFALLQYVHISEGNYTADSNIFWLHFKVGTVFEVFVINIYIF